MQSNEMLPHQSQLTISLWICHAETEKGLQPNMQYSPRPLFFLYHIFQLALCSQGGNILLPDDEAGFIPQENMFSLLQCSKDIHYTVVDCTW